jgi:cytosine/adenosine deaminase-related metal-dependent hydrolase
LRDTFASAAHEAGVDWYDLKVLMNHALPSSGDVTMGYVRVSVDHLRDATERIAGFLLAKMGATAPSSE